MANAVDGDNRKTSVHQATLDKSVVSTYDWPMTSTEKLMDKYAYKVDLAQCIRRLDAVTSSLTCGQREMILQAFGVIRQLFSEVWETPESSAELIPALCAHLAQKGVLETLVQLFISNNHDLRLETGEMLECCLSVDACSYIIQEGFIKNLVKVILKNSNGESQASQRLSAGLLEALFRHGPETCKVTVEQGGLDYLIEICKSRAEDETLLHTAAALSNLSIFGGTEMHRLMVHHHVPVWLFVLASHEDRRIKHYGCLCFCAIASTKEIEKSLEQCDTLSLVTSFLKIYKPEEIAKMDIKYRSGRTKEYLAALGPLLQSQMPQVSAMAVFQLAMESTLRKGSAKIDVFTELGFLSRIKEIASSSGFELGGRLAVQILKVIGEMLPYKLSQSVPLWTTKDVQFWLQRVGYKSYAQAFAKNRIDGDLLLRMTNETLRDDVDMVSAYERMRFVRELNSLKRSADYSAVDRGRLDSWLMNLDVELSVYTYQLLLKGVDRHILLHLDDDILRDVCGIKNGVHRWKIIRAIKEAKHVADLDLALLRKKIDIFICYRRSSGGQLASLLKVYLQLSGYKVFLDVGRLYAGQFNQSILLNVRAAKHFVIVLTPNALNPCIGDDECKDWVHSELKTALECKANIIPVQEKGFEWPSTESLPADIKAICTFNSIHWVHDYQYACVEKLHKYICEKDALKEST